MTNSDSTSSNRLILIVSFLQGVLMYVLYRALETQGWPADDPIWLMALICALSAIPIFFILLLESDNQKGALKFLAVYAVIITAAGAYAGLQQLPVDLFRNEDLYFAFFLTMSIATFKALMYSQVRSRGNSISYTSLFHYSWRNILLFGLGCLFTLLSIGLLFLWGALFNLIDIHFFIDIFEEPWFLFPASTTAFGFAIIIFRSLSNIIDSLSRLLRTMIRFLLPALALLAVMFICFLPFTGLQPLWDTRFGSTMMLWLQALLFFAVNAVYQGDSDDQPYPLMLHRLIYAGIAVMPLYSIIALHGLFTRIDQYGLTVSRSWGVIVAFILACFAVGYLWNIVRKKDAWLHGLAQVNIAMGLLVIVLMLLANSPLLNLQALSASSQIARIEKGQIEPDELDVFYFRRSLGRQGYLALEEAKNSWGQSHPQLVENIERIYSQPEHIETPEDIPSLLARLTIWPADRIVPELVLQDMLQVSFSNVSQYYAVFADLNDDGSEEVLIMLQINSGFVQNKIWSWNGTEWTNRSYRTQNWSQPIDFSSALENNNVEVIEPEWKSLRIGGATYMPMDE